MSSSKIRYTGTSGIDVESLVTQLMEAESLKKDKVYQQRQLLQWQQDSLRSIGNNIKTFQNKFLSFTSSASQVNMRSASSFSTNTAKITLSGSESSKISAKPSYSAKPGNREVEVVSVAQGEKRTSSSKVEGVIEGKTEIDYDAIKEGDNFNIKFNGSTLNVAFSQEDVDALASSSDKGATLENIVQSKLDDKFGKYNGESKVTFEVNNDKVSIKSNEDVNGEVSFSGFTSSQNKYTALTAAELKTSEDDEKNPHFKLEIGGETIDIKTKKDDGTVKTNDELLEEINNSISDKGIDGVAASFDDSGNLVLTSDYHTTDKEIKVSDMNEEDPEKQQLRETTLEGSVKSLDLGIPKYQSSNSFNLDKTFEEAFGTTGTMDFTINGKSFSIDSSVTTIEDAMNQINSSGAGVKMEYDSIGKTFSLQSTSVGSMSDIEFGGDASSFFGNLNISTADASTLTEADGFTKAQDSVVKIDGIQVVRESNSFEYDNITYDVSGATAGDVFNVNVSTNSDSAFDNIKNFVNEYNALIDEMQTATSETRKKSGSYSYYEPLTEDEKSAMSEDEVEKYEEAAKTGILNRDERLTKLTSALRNAMNQPVTLEDGSKMYLHEIGITTGDYTNGAKLEINEDKLRTAIEERGADIATLFTSGDESSPGLMERVNDAITDSVGTKGYITQYAGFKDTVYVTQNTLSKKIDKQDDKLAELETYLYNKENHYYTLFSAMETSVNQSNNELSYLLSYSSY